MKGPRAAGSGLPFVKMHGLGNDFVLLDGRAGGVPMDGPRARAIADRRTGVGCDQILIVTESTDPGCSWGYRVINADGTEVEQCGNGVRCVARWLHDQGELPPQGWLDSAAGPMQYWIGDDGEVAVDMGLPEFEPEQIPFRARRAALEYSREIAGTTVRFAALSMGNPHAVIRVDEIADAPVSTLGPAVQAEAGFSDGVNVGFMQVTGPGRIALRVFERGVGETRACGSGACAAAVAARRWGLTQDVTEVRLPGGTLTIEWSGEGQRVMMRGSASYAFTGNLPD